MEENTNRINVVEPTQKEIQDASLYATLTVVFLLVSTIPVFGSIIQLIAGIAAIVLAVITLRAIKNIQISKVGYYLLFIAEILGLISILIIGASFVAPISGSGGLGGFGFGIMLLLVTAVLRITTIVMLIINAVKLYQMKTQ